MPDVHRRQHRKAYRQALALSAKGAEVPAPMPWGAVSISLYDREDHLIFLGAVLDEARNKRAACAGCSCRAGSM